MDYMEAGLTGHERVTKVVLAVLIVFDILPLEVSAASSEERAQSVHSNDAVVLGGSCENSLPTTFLANTSY